MDAHPATQRKTGDLTGEARALVNYVAKNTDEKYGFGTLTTTVYDTAWLALVTKPVNGKPAYLFPESFQYILKTQSLQTGAWTGDLPNTFDAVLNTLAGLLVLKRHQAAPLQIPIDSAELNNRITLAISALNSKLAVWDVSTTNFVAFEVIVPAMMELLEKEDPSLVFDFPGKKMLLEVNQAKMSKFRPEFLYSGKIVTLTHSLECFIGKIDFDKVGQFKVNGSMFASPSSAAAYLMHATKWDDECEDYCRAAVRLSIGKGDGSVPGVWPTSTFEYTWVLSTLFRAGFTAAEVDGPELQFLGDILQKTFTEANGNIGLMPGIEADVDDSAKIVTTLNQIGRPTSARRLCEIFEVATHFRVYPGERDASPSANCNALLALLGQPDSNTYAPQISKIARFLCERQWNADLNNDDKWNQSHLYPTLLYTEALVDVVYQSEKGLLPGAFDTEFITKACITLFQACFRAMLEQKENGSWNDSLEATAYAILMLVEARRLSFFNDILEQVQGAIWRGIRYLEVTEFTNQNIWSDKVSYGSPSICQAYILAARKAASMPVHDASVGSSIWPGKIPTKLYKGLEVFHHTPLLKSMPAWEFRASMIESILYAPLLQDKYLELFPGDVTIKELYRPILPFGWVVTNNRSRTHASGAMLWQAMWIGFFTYQLDEFMEGQVNNAFQGRFDLVHQIIDEVMAQSSGQANGNGTAAHTNGNGHAGPVNIDYFKTNLAKARDALLDNPIIRESSNYDFSDLREELRILMHTHCKQLEDGARINKEQLQRDRSVSNLNESFYRWVRGTSADHVACPIAYAFMVCQVGSTLTPKGSKDCFPSPMDKYLGAAARGHLSSLARMENDLGSWRRDFAEGNLNCLHFPEFGAGNDDEVKRATLYRMAEYERSRFYDARAQLHENMFKEAPNSAVKRLAGRRLKILDVMCDSTELWGQLYILRDFTDPIKDKVRA